MPRLPPVPENVQEANRRRVGFFKWVGVAALVVGAVLALVGGLAGGIAALEVPGYGLIVGGLAYLVITPMATRFLDPRPYGSSRENRE